jgi:hypothetical protein
MGSVTLAAHYLLLKGSTMKERRILLCVLVLGAFCTVGWAAGEKKNVVSGLDVEFYTKIKVDASYSDSRVTPGNYVKMVDPEELAPSGHSYTRSNDNDDEFNLTANATRFGFLIYGPETDDWNFWGQLEFDLYGSSYSYYGGNGERANDENKPKLMTRHAFIVIERPADQWSILAGQTWDVVSPLNPGTLNYSVLWWAGNYGYRIPQIRFTKDVDIADDKTLQFQIALARTIGTDDTMRAYEPGADEGAPSVQGRVGLTVPGIGADPVNVGVSGHYGEEEHDYLPGVGTPGNVKSDDVKTWSVGLDVTLPIDEKIKLTGEIHTGDNLGRFNGAIGHTIYGSAGGAGTSGLGEVSSTGGWIAAALGPWDNLCYNIGYGIDNVDVGDAKMVSSSNGTPHRNSCIFGNAIYNFNEHAAVGLEVSWWETEYANSSSASTKWGDGDALVVQASWIYKTR